MEKVTREVADWLKATRMARGLGLDAAALAARVSKDQLAKYENGISIPLKHFSQLIVAYDARPEEAVAVILRQQRLKGRPPTNPYP